MSFSFKQFTINDHRCAQKVGTDAVLLGAWAPVEGCRCILDIGTGSGVVALMLAQRTGASITALDIDAESVVQAQQNAEASPWAQRLTTVCADVLQWEAPQAFDAIVSNPPFFERALECPDSRRTAARHTSSLPLDRLAAKASSLLRDGGTFTVILPHDTAGHFTFLCQGCGLFPTLRCNVRTVPRKPFRRSLLHFTKGVATPYDEATLTLLAPGGGRMPEHQALTRHFYL